MLSRHWSTMVIQRSVNDHTSYIISFRAKCEVGQEAIEYWSASNLMLQFRLLHPSRTWGITRDEQGCHHLPPSPQPWDAIISKGSRAPKYHACVQGNYQYPPEIPTLWIDKQEYRQPRRKYELPPQP